MIKLTTLALLLATPLAAETFTEYKCDMVEHNAPSGKLFYSDFKGRTSNMDGMTAVYRYEEWSNLGVATSNGNTKNLNFKHLGIKRSINIDVNTGESIQHATVYGREFVAKYNCNILSKTATK